MGKNSVGPSEFTDFEQFELKHTENTKTILATTSANHTGEAITLRQNRSTSHIPSIWGTRARSERPPAGPEKYTEVLENHMSNQNFRILSSSDNADFSIRKSKISSHGTRCVSPYNFFMSQRPTMILSETDIQSYSNYLAKKLF